jgi:ribosome-binding protein aMBF1 (putative translation factor)
LSFELPSDWENVTPQSHRKQHRSVKGKRSVKPHDDLLGEQVLQARKAISISQRELAKLAGKSQSWIRDVENGRLKPKSEDQLLLRRILNIL